MIDGRDGDTGCGDADANWSNLQAPLRCCKDDFSAEDSAGTAGEPGFIANCNPNTFMPFQERGFLLHFATGQA